ncbi:MAG: hypothetical protein Q9163_004781 [Psora crenata]
MAQDATALLSQANKAASSAASGFSFFGGKAEKYENAVELYTKAANAFRLQQNGTEAGRAYEQAAALQKNKLNEPDDMANTLQEAYKAYKKTSPQDAARVLSQAIDHYLSKGNFRRAATQKQYLAELYEEIQDRREARAAYEDAARWYEDDNAAALANKLNLKAGDLAALDGDYMPAIQHFEHVARQSVSNNLMRFSVKDYLLRAGICHLAHDTIGAKRALQSYVELDPSFAQQREHQLLVDLTEAVEAGDSEVFAEKLYRYDQLSPLNPWCTTLLLSNVGIRPPPPLRRRYGPATAWDEVHVPLKNSQYEGKALLQALLRKYDPSQAQLLTKSRQGMKYTHCKMSRHLEWTNHAIYNSKHFSFILPKHEQGAGHMAEGYARASGRPGVVLVTSGPGATNVITAIQDALSDGTPLVVFSGQVPTTAIGTDSFQEADVIGITRACTKWNVMVKRLEELPKRIKEAFEIATTGRPGPVLVDLPKDVTAAILRNPIPTSSTLPPHPSAASLAATELRQKQLEGAIGRVAKLINIAKKPVIYAGQGMIAVPEGPKLLAELAQKCQIPTTTTLQGLGGFDETNDLSLHMLGMHGSPFANLAIQEADLIIALGARFDDRVTGSLAKFAPEAKAAEKEKRGGIIHFEIMPKNINKVVQATEAVEGDVATNLALLLPHLTPVSARPEWLGQIADWKARLPFSYDKGTPDGLIKPQSVIEKLSELTAGISDRTIITTGVGQHQMWAAQHYTWRYPRTMITSGGLGTMGYGLPAAIGAKVARPDCLVVDVDGDASFNMTLTELSTAAQFGIAVKILVLNNEEQGMVTQWQSLFYEDRFSHTHQKNPDFIKLAEAMGVQARRCIAPNDVEDSLRWLIEGEGPQLLDMVTDTKVPVLPMVPAGAGLHEFLVYDEAKEKERRAKAEVVYTVLFDSIINAYLMAHCDRNPSTSDQIGLVVSSYCHFFAPVGFPVLLDLGLRVNKLGRSSVTYEVGVFEHGCEHVKAVGGYTHVFVDRKAPTMAPAAHGIPAVVRIGLAKLVRGGEKAKL